MKPILILGNGGGGTSLLRGLLNAHSKLHIEFEEKGGGGGIPAGEIDHWLKISEKCSLRWGNKIPVEQFISRGWSDLDIISLVDYFEIIFLRRRFSRYDKGGTHFDYKGTWEWANDLCWCIRERSPEHILQVSFEELILRPEIELKRICVFLGIDYEEDMLKGTMDTGKANFNQVGFNKDKI